MYCFFSRDLALDQRFQVRSADRQTIPGYQESISLSVDYNIYHTLHDRNGVSKNALAPSTVLSSAILLVPPSRHDS